MQNRAGDHFIPCQYLSTMVSSHPRHIYAEIARWDLCPSFFLRKVFKNSSNTFPPSPSFLACKPWMTSSDPLLMTTYGPFSSNSLYCDEPSSSSSSVAESALPERPFCFFHHWIRDLKGRLTMMSWNVRRLRVKGHALWLSSHRMIAPFSKLWPQRVMHGISITSRVRGQMKSSGIEGTGVEGSMVGMNRILTRTASYHCEGWCGEKEQKKDKMICCACKECVPGREFIPVDPAKKKIMAYHDTTNTENCNNKAQP